MRGQVESPERKNVAKLPATAVTTKMAQASSATSPIAVLEQPYQRGADDEDDHRPTERQQEPGQQPPVPLLDLHQSAKLLCKHT
jgi:hypothetical protein